jgi:hypothetical protein
MSDKIELLNCPFCGTDDVDPTGVLNGDGTRSPECMGCGATAPTVATWNCRITTPAEDVRAVVEEPVYMYRRKGFDSWATCERKRFDLLSVHNCFEVDTLYRRGNACLDAVEELNK